MQPSAAQIGQRVSIRMHEADGGFRDILGSIRERKHSTQKRWFASHLRSGKDSGMEDSAK